MKELEIKEAKRKLYLLLLKKDPEDLTENEVELLYYLCMDPSIQEVINAHL